jgi:predicted PurR-regulated permease PerM
MSEKNSSIFNFQEILDSSLKLIVLAILFIACFLIIKPFFYIILWGIFIAITIYPLHNNISSKLNGRDKLSATLITLIILALILFPTAFLMESMIEGIISIGGEMKSGQVTIPPPPDEVGDWPLIGRKLSAIWSLASKNLESFLNQYESQLISIGSWLIESLMATTLGFFQMILSIIVSGFLLAFAAPAGQVSKKFFTKLAGDKGIEFAETSEITVRNVSKGIIGVAIIQFLLAGIGFALAGVPFAGLWALLVLFLAIIQISAGLVTIPVIIYLFTVMNPLGATLWGIYFVLVGLSDNVLKPVLLGKGAPVPMAVIFIGTLGGFIGAGFVGLFLGAIVLSLGYKLYMTWMG